MRGIFSLLALLLVLLFGLAGGAGVAEAETVGSADAAAIRQVIADQIEAFQRNDAEAAFAYASPAIQERFGTAERFLSMVRTMYGPVYRPRELAFQELVEGAGPPVQRVLVVGADGVAMIALYEMQRQPDGSWRIHGVTLAPAAQQRAGAAMPPTAAALDGDKARGIG